MQQGLNKYNQPLHLMGMSIEIFLRDEVTAKRLGKESGGGSGGD